MSNIVRFPATSARAILARWPFLTVEESRHCEPLPIRGRATPDGPVVEYNSRYLPQAMLDDPSITVAWLTPCLMQIAVEVLENDVHPENGGAKFESPRWSAFRDEASRLMLMSWAQVLKAVQREGVDFEAEHLTNCFIIESGLSSDLEDASHG